MENQEQTKGGSAPVGWPSTVIKVLALGVVGFFIGGIIGFFLGELVGCPQENLCGVMGFYGGSPLGTLAGLITGIVFAIRQYKSRESRIVTKDEPHVE